MMPVYVYATKDGETVERFYSLGKAPDVVRIGGKPAVRNITATHQQDRHTSGARWPILSEAAGVHPAQVKEAAELDRQMGIPTNYTPDGRVEFRNHGHQKAWLKAHKGYNKDAYG